MSPPASNELVFIVFYTEWCHFSKTTVPEFDEAAKQIREEFPEMGRVVLAKVNCEVEEALAHRFRISYYPTFKIVCKARTLTTPYNGKRTAEAFVEFIREEMKDPVAEFTDLEELVDLETDKGITYVDDFLSHGNTATLRYISESLTRYIKGVIAGYFHHKGEREYNTFRLVAMNLREKGQFFACFTSSTKTLMAVKSKDSNLKKVYAQDLTDFNGLYVWARKQCTPLVRQLNYKNVNEITDEGLPFFLLFHADSDEESVQKFTKVVQKDLSSETGM